MISQNRICDIKNVDFIVKRRLINKAYLYKIKGHVTTFLHVFQVRISVMTTLTPTTLQIDEGWYDVKDGSKIIELEGPILLNKISSHPGDR